MFYFNKGFCCINELGDIGGTRCEKIPFLLFFIISVLVLIIPTGAANAQTSTEDKVTIEDVKKLIDEQIGEKNLLHKKN